MKSLKLMLLFIILPSLTSYASDRVIFDNADVIGDVIWASLKVEVPTEVLLTICYGESNFRITKHLTHMDGGSLSHGVCQIKLSTALYMDDVFKHKTRATALRLENPAVNAFYAAKYLKYQMTRYKNLKLAIDAYNKHNAVSAQSVYVKKYEKNFNIFKNRMVFLKNHQVYVW